MVEEHLSSLNNPQNCASAQVPSLNVALSLHLEISNKTLYYQLKLGVY